MAGVCMSLRLKTGMTFADVQSEGRVPESNDGLQQTHYNNLNQ